MIKIFSDVVWRPGIFNRRAAYCFCESSFLIHHGVLHKICVSVMIH